MKLTQVVLWIVGYGVLSHGALGQFQTANIAAHAGARSYLDATGGSGTLDKSGGDGAYPMLVGMANADQTFGTSSVFANAQVGIELSPIGLSASGMMHTGMEITEETLAGDCAAIAQTTVEFSLIHQMIWTIPSGHATASNGQAFLRLRRENTTLFDYSGTIAGQSGILEPGTYTLLLEASGGSDFATGGAASDASFALEFQLSMIRICIADFNADNMVDDGDFVIFVNSYDILDCADASMPAECIADLNGDLLVDDADFSIFVVAYDALLCPE